MANGARVSKSAWANRIVDHAEVDPHTLTANPKNWRKHSDIQRRAISGSLTEVGWVRAILVNRTTGNVVDGHARISEAIRQGEPLVPVDYVDLTEAQEELALATLDPLGLGESVHTDHYALPFG
jgi:hypothetical protein